MRFYKALTLLFIGLKLTEHIDWSWWWILAPSILGGVIEVTTETVKDLKEKE